MTRRPDRRSPEAQQYRALYKTAAWRNGRLRFLDQHPLCERCQAIDRVTAATVVHHRKPHKGEIALFLDQNNWMALCAPCHDRPTQQDEKLGYSKDIGIDGWPLSDDHPAYKAGR